MNGHEPESRLNPLFAGTAEVTAPETESAPALSPSAQRFQTCRWRKAAENGVPDYCTHRDVHPIAGTTGFTADSWCPECGNYKVRRNPRKRPATPEDRYYY